LHTQKYAVIATNNEKIPYTNIVAFAASQGLGNIFFATKSDSTKYFNLLNNPCVSILIDNRKNLASDIKKARAVAAEAEAKGIKENKEKFKELLRKRHPELSGFLNEPNCELFKLEVKKYFYVDNFEKKHTITINSKSP
jgi:general stress protein 26